MGLDEIPGMGDSTVKNVAVGFVYLLIIAAVIGAVFGEPPETTTVLRTYKGTQTILKTPMMLRRTVMTGPIVMTELMTTTGLILQPDLKATTLLTGLKRV